MENHSDVTISHKSKQGIILFDGVCVLCNSAVRFIIRYDKKGYFKFASLQSPFAKILLNNRNLPLTEMQSIILIDDDTVYTMSDAILNICKKLDGIWPVFYVFKLLPLSFRNYLYKIIAKYRYAWFGIYESCKLPSDKIKARFLN